MALILKLDISIEYIIPGVLSFAPMYYRISLCKIIENNPEIDYLSKNYDVPKEIELKTKCEDVNQVYKHVHSYSNDHSRILNIRYFGDCYEGWQAAESVLNEIVKQLKDDGWHNEDELNSLFVAKINCENSQNNHSIDL